MLLCPHCGARGVGKVGSSQYYCWECCVEFKATRKGWLVYEVLDDGSLAAVGSTDDRSCVCGLAGSMGPWQAQCQDQ